MQAETRDEMRDKILEAALKRFTHYGASKTTMNEIAEDLRCSKASLYYYFPDKNGMHMAVLEKIGEAYFQEMEKEVAHIKSAAKTLHNIIEIRKKYICKFSRLELFRIMQEASEEIHEQVRLAKKREIELHAEVIKAGVALGEFKVKNHYKTAELLIQSLLGLRFAVPADMERRGADYDFDELEAIVLEKQKTLLDIFIRGIKA
ncbi:TetR/AcrR family transcriptional regulator [Chitinophaga vietnamensis]|uniref:TetR/AcrR family transcriptional regulator n=1 Tax=Chitinophaga vietnamensis TaxID=2593957 RepID=UPI00117858A0|nr:TetR/AcrR family transcriptional regulator [Chitinophaga vietnamensis]